MISTLHYDILLENINKAFIETGTENGYGVELALKLQFEIIRSVEMRNELFEMNLEKFKNFSNVKIYHGKSEDKLSEMIQDLDYPCTFWLDAHDRGSCPILKELEIINNHQIKNHTILIDDMESFRIGWLEGIQVEELEEKIYKINPKYNIQYVGDNNILMAKIY
jgi:hypothetical protein